VTESGQLTRRQRSIVAVPTVVIAASPDRALNPRREQINADDRDLALRLDSYDWTPVR